MPVAFRNSGSDTYSATRSPVVNKPSGVVDGDLILIAAFTGDGAGAASAIPSGWTQIGTVQDTNATSPDGSLVLIWKIASGEGSSWTLTNLWDANETGICGVAAYSGAHPTAPIHKNAQANGAISGGAAVSGPSITPDIPDCMIVQFCGADGEASMSASPDTSPSANERVDANDGVFNWVYIQDYLQGAAAAIALDALSLSEAENVARFQIAIAPSANNVPVKVHHMKQQGMS